MFLENNQSIIKVFLADTSVEMQKVRQILYAILKSAGMQIVEANENQKGQSLLEKVDCSIHIIGNNYSQIIEEQLNLSREFNSKNERFKIFIWKPTDNNYILKDKQQEEFINSIRNNIFRNMIYTNHESPVMFTEDIRSIMHSEKQLNYNAKEIEVFFIHNEIDEDSVKNIVEMLNDVVSLQVISIVLNSNTDYSELISQQIAKSQLTVIFFKRSVNWALPFTQQIWKKIGGASSGSNILLVGDASHEQNTKINFQAPNVSFLAISSELIPLEIKVQLDKLTQVEK